MTFVPVAMYAVCTILPMLATLAIMARIKVRLLRKTKLQVDDWTTFAALIMLWSIAGIVIAGTAQGLFGSHTYQDPKTGKSKITRLDQQNVKYMWIVVVIGIFTIGLVKLSVVLLYRRIFAVSRAFDIYTLVLLVLVVVWIIGFLAANIFQCGAHPAAAWTSATTFWEYCYDTSPATAARLLTNIIMDLMILAAPMGMIWRLQLTVAQKLQVTGIFALGFISVAAGAVRAEILLTDTYGPDMGFRDLRGQNTDVVAWTLIEIVAALVGCCLPTLRPLLVDTSMGRSLGNFLTAFSLPSHTSRSYEHEHPREKLAIVTIGGTNMKKPVVETEDEACSPIMHDVGSLT